MTSTTNYGFKKLGSNQPLTPGGGGFKSVTGVLNQTTTDVGGYNDLVTAVDAGLIRRIDWVYSEDLGTTLDIEVKASQDYGSAELGKLNVANYVLLGLAGDFSIVKDGTGIAATATPKMAIGTAKASNATLANAMVDIIDGFDLGNSATEPWKPNLLHNNTVALKFLAPATEVAPKLFLNTAVTISADGALTVTGTLTLWVLDVGGPVPAYTATVV